MCSISPQKDEHKRQRDILTIDYDFHSPGVRRGDVVPGAAFVLPCCISSYSRYVHILSSPGMLG